MKFTPYVSANITGNKPLGFKTGGENRNRKFQVSKLKQVAKYWFLAHTHTRGARYDLHLDSGSGSACN